MILPVENNLLDIVGKRENRYLLKNDKIERVVFLIEMRSML
jgi:hypothetical protein